METAIIWFRYNYMRCTLRGCAVAHLKTTFSAGVTCGSRTTQLCLLRPSWRAMWCVSPPGHLVLLLGRTGGWGSYFLLLLPAGACVYMGT